MTDNTIAVLPFVNMSSDPENEYFSDGITEEIINALARIDSLKVTSRTSSFFFKNKSIPLQEIAGQLGVAVILEGSVRLAGDMVRITAQLIQTKDDFHFWSETWDRKLENIFDIQDEISLAIADKIREQYGHFELTDHLVEKQTENLDAYAYALKAQYHFNKWNPEDVRQAIDLYEKAIALDPKHTESYVGLADAYGFMATTEFMPRAETWQKATEYTYKAYELNPQNAGVHYQLANLSFFTQADFQEAFAHARKSIELKPNYPEAQQFMAFLYMLRGKMDLAGDHLDRALSIDPLSQETLFYKAYYQYRKCDYRGALHLLDENLAKNPKNIPASIARSYCLLKLGRYKETIGYLDQIPDELVMPDEQLGIRCLAYLLKKDEEHSARCLTALEERAKDPHAFQAHSYLFLSYVNSGQVEKAFSWLEEAIQLKSAILLLTFSDPLAESLRQDERYAHFSQRLYQTSVPTEKIEAEKTPLLDAETAAAYSEDLLRYMKEEAPFLNPGLSLRDLAAQVQIHPNQLSWLLNQHLGKNFNEFVNHYRVEHFKKLAVDPDNAHISIIGLAYESGFNSKTVFNTYFKKEVGMTPGAFMKQQR